MGKAISGWLVAFALIASLPIVAQQINWDEREKGQIEDLYKMIYGTPDVESIKAIFDKVLSRDPAAVPELVGLLGHSNRMVSRQAAMSLGGFATPAATAALKNALATGENPTVRAGALVGLGRMRDLDANRLAEEALVDTNATVRAIAVGVLEELGDARSAPALIAYYDRSPDEDEDVLEILGRLGDPPGRTTVRDKLLSEAMTKSRPWSTRVCAAKGLKSMGLAHLVQRILDRDLAEKTCQFVIRAESAFRLKAARMSLVIKSQGDAETALTRVDLGPYRNDAWGQPFRVKFVSEGIVRAVSNGPDGQPNTPDDISTVESSIVYLSRVFGDLER